MCMKCIKEIAIANNKILAYGIDEEQFNTETTETTAEENYLISQQLDFLNLVLIKLTTEQTTALVEELVNLEMTALMQAGNMINNRKNN